MNKEFLDLLIAWNGGVERGAQAKLSKLLEVSKVTMLRWVKNDLKPSEKQIKKMASIFKKSEQELKNIFNITPKTYSNVTESKIELTYIPVRGVSSATEEKFILEETETFLPFKKTAPNQFAIKIVGNCMVDPDDPRNSIYDGDYVIVDPDAPVANGDVVVARIDGEYSTVKRLYKHDKEVRLIPDNPACKPIIRKSATFIVGKVIDIYRPVRAKKERKL